MDNCARCGKELLWHEQKMVFWNKQLQKGYIKWYVIGSMEFGKRKEFPEYTGKKLCQLCAHEVFTGTLTSRANHTLPSQEQKKPQADNLSGDIADFASLRLFLKQNGVVMSAFNCPKCGGMVDIPESGKLLICKHCGNPIKPAEIAEKIKALTE
jgi:DNA-directed RNA polymerase subunit RPC12/RpoP